MYFFVAILIVKLLYVFYVIICVGISLGSALAESKLSTNIICAFATFFALTWCVGAVIGIFYTPDSTGDIVQGL
jgi:hypothetical protein